MSCENPTSELPGEAAAGEEFAQGGTTPPLRRSLRTLRVFVGPSVLCRPRFRSRLLRKLRRPLRPLLSSMFRAAGVRGRKVPHRRPSVPCEGHHSPSESVVCGLPAALRSSAAGSFQAVTPLPPLRCASFPQKSPVPPLLGKPSAWLYLAAIPPGLSALPLPCGPR